MPIEIREPTVQSSHGNYGGTGEFTAAPDHPEPNGNDAPQSNPYISLRTQYAPNSVAPDRPESNTSTHRQSRSTWPASRSSADPSPERRPRDRRVKDVVSLHEQRSKQTNGKPPVKERSNSRRVSSGPTFPDAGSSNKGGSLPEEVIDTPKVNSHSDVQPALPPMPWSNDLPALKYMDWLTKQPKRRTAYSRDLNTRPSTADGPIEKENGVVPTVKEFRRSRSSVSLGEHFANSSPGDRKPSPPPTRRQSLSHSRPTSLSGRLSRPEQPSESRPYARSNSSLSERRSSRGISSSNNNPSLKQENRGLGSANSKPAVRTRPSINEDFDFEFKSGDAGSSGSRPSTDLWQADVPANSTIAASHARHDGTTGTLKQEDVPADFGGRHYTRTHSMSHRSRLEDSSDSADGPGPRSRNPRKENASHLPPTRLESNGNFTLEHPPDYSHIRRRQGGTSGNLKDDRTSGTREIKRSLDVESLRASASFRRRPGSNHSVNVAFKGVADAWYNNGWLPLDGMVPFPDDIAGLNKFLNDCRSEVEAGVPGRFLTVVLGKATSDLDSIVSTVVYAYFLSCTGGKQDSKLFLPVINIRQEELALHTEAVWLFKATGVDTSNFIFVDQISLQYYHRFGNLQLVLVDHSMLAPHQESLKEAVIEIVDNNVTEEIYSWVLTRDIQEVGSCCTIIAERFAAEAPEHLAGRGLNRLLLGPILLETANLDAKAARCTTRDECMAALLINGAGRHGQQGFFRFLRKMKFDISELSTRDMLRKDFKQWTLGPGNTDGFKGRVMTAAMSTLGVPLIDILNRKHILHDLNSFERKFNLDLHLVVTGYYDNSDRYKREILLVPKDIELTQHLITCFSAHKQALKLASIDVKGLPEEMLVFRQGLVTASRKVLCKILVDYFAV